MCVFLGPGSGPGCCSTSTSRGSAGLATVISLTSEPAAPPRGGVWVAGPRVRGVGLGGGFGRPGGDLLFRALRRSTIGAEGFHGRVRDGIGCYAPRYGHQAVQSRARPRELGERLVERGPGLDPGPSSPSGRPKRVVSVCCRRGLPPWLGGTRVPPVRFAAGRGRGKPIERLVPVSCAGCPASTSGLST